MKELPYRIAMGSCSHTSLPQPLWKIIRAREPAAFVWAGDAVYSDRFTGLNWTAVGIRRIRGDGGGDVGGGWRMTFPPPSVHLDATPDVIRGQYEAQWDVDDYRRFVEGWDDAGRVTRPVIFGTIDDHDYGQENGDITYQHKRYSNLAFTDFLYSGIPNDNNWENFDAPGEKNMCQSTEEEDIKTVNGDVERRSKSHKCHRSHTKSRIKSNDPMYQRAREGKGVYGVQLFDFSRRTKSISQSRKLSLDNIIWGGGYWVTEEDARIDPDIMNRQPVEVPFNETVVNYSITHSVAIFALDVRSNKTPWPTREQKHSTPGAFNLTNKSSIAAPALDFLGKHQWEWLRSALANSRAAVNIIVSGLQIHPERFPNDGSVIEEWSKFPEARQMLYDMILESGVRSPLLVTGDVHMSQILRKDCVRLSDILDGSTVQANPTKRPLVEITTSGMTHSWGTFFSSEPKHHRLPLKPYSYFVSWAFMTICHIVCPWNDILIRNADGVAAVQGQGNPHEAVERGQIGKQYYLGLNFLELEFEFHDQEQDDDIKGGAVIARILGKHTNASPELEMRWTFDQLSGNTHLPGITAKPQDFLTAEYQKYGMPNSQMEREWICVPYRGLASVYHEYAANVIMFLTFCFLLFLPHGLIVLLLIVTRRRCLKWKYSGN